MPIGNLTSQFFSNLYLNGFDHYVKEIIGAKYYIRYCDDFVVFGDSKAFLAEVKESLSNYLQTIKLALHENKSRIYQTSDGVDFLGFRIFPHYMKVRKRVVKGYRKKLKEMAIDYGNGQIDANKITRSIHSWIGHVKHANSYGLRKELISHAVFRRQTVNSSRN
ncbi:MAG: RNA-directed DNA polymerase [Candidatus Brocadiaceae bacterium]|nr:RNA-directed DNA polymerase [Candidatus Brocadiaceae bacterium]